MLTIIAVYSKTVQKLQAMLRSSRLPEHWSQVIWNGLCSYFAGCKTQFTSILPITVTVLPFIQAIWLLFASSPVSPKETASLSKDHKHGWDQCCSEPLTCLCLVLKQSAQIPWLPGVDSLWPVLSVHLISWLQVQSLPLWSAKPFKTCAKPHMSLTSPVGVGG